VGRTSIVLLYLLACIVGLHFEVGAQVESTSSTLDDTLQNVMIHASRMPVAHLKQVQQVHMINQSEISSAQSASTADVLSQSGKVYVQKSQLGGGSVVMRGFEANKVLLVLDGIRLNNSIYRSGHLQNILSIDPNSIQTIELLYGPSSVAYGSDALGGVVYLHTKDVHNNSVSTINAKLSSASAERTMQASAPYQIGKLNVLSSFSYSHFGDLIKGKNDHFEFGKLGERYEYTTQQQGQDLVVKNDNIHMQVGSAYKQWNVLQKISTSSTKSINHTATVLYSTTSNVPRYDRLSEQRNGKPVFAEWYYGPQSLFFTNINTTINKANKLYDNLRFNFAYQQAKESRNDRAFGSEILSQRKEKVQVLTLNFDGLIERKRHKLNYGLETIYDNVGSIAYGTNIKSYANSRISTRYPDGGTNSGSIGLFLMDLWTVDSNTSIQGGVRWNTNWLNTKFTDKSFFSFLPNQLKVNNSALTGSIGIIKKISKKSTLSVNLANGFRSPNLDDIGKIFDSQIGRVVVPNPSLQAEYLYTVDARYTLNSYRFHFEICPFYSHYSNALALQKTKVNGQDSLLFNGVKSEVFHTANYGKARIAGISLDAKMAISKYVHLGGTCTVTKGQILSPSPKPLDHIPPCYGIWYIKYRQNRLELELNSLYNFTKESADYNLDGEDNQRYSVDPINGYTPDWHTFNVHIQYKLNKKLGLAASCENILDSNYRTFASGISGTGRNFGLQLRLQF
jgi:hemoglobin/transferrin/lactoferrin receptor protein